MPRKPSDVVTATVSICVSEDEHALIRDAAAAVSLSVSSWAASRLAASLANRGATTAVGEAAKRIANAETARGSRKGRVSMVLREHDKLAMDKAAERLKITPHAYAQAATLDVADRELRALPAPQRRILEQQRKTASAAGSSLVTIPTDLSDVDPVALVEMLRKLVDGTSTAILAGNGRVISEGVARMAASLANVSTKTLRVGVPEFDFQAPAHVLGVPWKDYALTLTVKAARAVKG